MEKPAYSYTLIKIDSAKNQQRFYNLHLAPALFNEWSVVREWGRIGSSGTVKIDMYLAEKEARKMLELSESRKSNGDTKRFRKRAHSLINQSSKF